MIISSPPFVCGFLGSWIGKRLPGKTILNISDLWPQSANELGFLRKGLLYKLLLGAEKKMYIVGTDQTAVFF